jgi:hypothetical protein
MRVFNENKTTELFIYDLEKGYLKSDKLFVKYHEPIEAVEEQGHYETIAEYENGGKDVKWVVDIQGVKAKDAWEEWEDIQIYIPYTESELNKIKQQKYENKVEALIRAKYSLSQELAILRQRDTKPTEFAEYNAYAESCKAQAKIEFGVYLENY